MKCVENDSPAFITSLHNAIANAPYNSSLATSASTSSTSVWSDASSQDSDDSSSSAPISDSESCRSCCSSSSQQMKSLPNACNQEGIRFTSPWSGQSHSSQPEVPLELRQNPRRTSTGSTTRNGCPPQLIRQSDRKVNFVDSLVDSSTQIVETIWPLSSVFYRTEMGSRGVLPLRTFIQETLRRSRTSYSTLQVALYYLILIKPHVPKHDFTMEQPDDAHAIRVLQCGRRMFLAALILASKYLQDRNYSARAWSKISGLNTQEINQNEIAFLLAVDWKLHITDDVFQRWTEIVLKYTPSPSPPSPGIAPSQRSMDPHGLDWRQVILQLNPQLDNIEGLVSNTSQTKTRDLASISRRALCTFSSQDRFAMFVHDSAEATPTPKAINTPAIMEPSPATVCTPSRLAPALGLLPTPRLTPHQPSAFNTPAVSAVSYMLGKGSMGLAMSQAASVNAMNSLDRWPVSNNSSPQLCFSARRPSFPSSISTTSSPESMISDSSRLSRSSSISSASSLAHAPSSTKLEVLARRRSAKQCGERLDLRIVSVPEDYESNCMTASPESYTGPVGKDLLDLSLMETPLGRRERDMELEGAAAARDSANRAALALQEMHNSRQSDASSTEEANSVPHTVTKKRSRPLSMDKDNSLQETVREMLSGQYYTTESTAWKDTLVRPRQGAKPHGQITAQIPVESRQKTGRKRVCCSADASDQFTISSLHPAVGGVGGPGMWEGVFN